MRTYLIGRIGQAVLVLWAAFTVSFILLQALPADAILIKFQNPELGLSPQQIEEIRLAYGASAPLWQQYAQTLVNVVQGDFGYSVQRGVPVSESIAANLLPTLRLTGLAFLAAATLAAAIALTASLSRFNALRNFLRGLPALFISIPVFWLGIALIQVFSFQLGWIPVIGAGDWEGLVLPVITLSVPIAAPLAQVLIRSLDAVEVQPFVAVARAKGASRTWVLFRHTLRNALPPVLTLGGVLFGELIASAVVTETVFGLNGLGRLTEQAVNFQDAAVLQAVVIVAATGFVLINLLVDLLYPILDPRLSKKLEV